MSSISEKMVITKIEAIALRVPLQFPIMDAVYFKDSRDCCFVKIYTNKGITGYGEAITAGGPAVSTKAMIDLELAPLLIGEDPSDIEYLWQKMYHFCWHHGRRGIVVSAMSGLDIALWDIKGKMAGLPVYKLLGGYQSKIRAYASAGFYSTGNEEEIPKLVADAEKLVAKGFKGIKLKIGRTMPIPMHPLSFQPGKDLCLFSLEEDMKRIEAVRQTVGKDIALMVDANSAYTPYYALQVGRELEKLGVYFFEEPISVEDVEGSAALAAALDIQIAGYETEQTAYGFRHLIEKQAVDIVQPDVTWSGGITECRRIAAIAYAYNKICNPHSFTSAFCIAANMHLACSIPNSEYVEYDQVVANNPLIEKLLKEPIEISKDGYVEHTGKPGIGVEIDEDFFEKYAVR
ncbi:MAG TPA: mandelate racemase/muconate lactonizing enzyme family protein [Anaerovoracaceae bacterium]|nr:mandelate racemase/muconate lactonizing enzyme family protein [Anaerovoracaceae bacterium]